MLSGNMVSIDSQIAIYFVKHDLLHGAMAMLGRTRVHAKNHELYWTYRSIHESFASPGSRFPICVLSRSNSQRVECMYDYSFGPQSLLAQLRESDFRKMPQLTVTGPTESSAAAFRADALFWNDNPLEVLHVKGKQVFRPSSFQSDLILRKIRNNIRNSFHLRTRGRRFIVDALISHLGEGLPYRVYKRDVHRFYPSFSHSDVLKTIESRGRLPLLTIRLLERVFEGHDRLGGSGLPLGLGLSAVLSEMMMSTFDETFRSYPDVRFYARYVDDIVVITNGDEVPSDFTALLTSSLPKKLKFNSLKNVMRETDPSAPVTAPSISFSYLGYSIRVAAATKKELESIGRQVTVDLSPDKAKKIKTRVIRTLHSHITQPDFTLLKKRLAFLTSNTTLPVEGQSIKRLIGIYHTYPLLTVDSNSKLHELDAFLRMLLLSSSGRLTKRLQPLLTRKQRAQLLAMSFVEGYQKKRFISISAAQLKVVKRCWLNE
jgi:Reverse transcriptase (RNA-dependent DNA polymerase)